jgi:hypothetical protein
MPIARTSRGMPAESSGVGGHDAWVIGSNRRWPAGSTTRSRDVRPGLNGRVRAHPDNRQPVSNAGLRSTSSPALHLLFANDFEVAEGRRTVTQI